MGLDPAKEKTPVFDASDRKYMEIFLQFALKPNEEMGAAFWWLDWQQDYIQPYVRGMRVRHLSWLNYLYYRHSLDGNLRGAVYSRWGGWDSQRYPIQFSGDTYASWESLAFQVEMTATSGNAGCFFWATEAMRRAYRLRSRLMPYIYSSLWQAHCDRVPLTRAMYIDYPGDEATYRNPLQYLFGNNLLVVPVTSPGEGAAMVATQDVWFPEGDRWFGFFDNKEYPGGNKVRIEAPIDEFPLFVERGMDHPDATLCR